MGESVLARLEHRLYIELRRKKLKNKTPSIIASNCNGSFIMHDLGIRFNSPTVNLFFEPEGFLKFLSDIDSYLSVDPIKVNSPYKFPVGKINDVYIFFMHFSSFDEAFAKWNERKKRIDKNNLFVIMTERNGCSYEDLKRFDELPYKNKVVFTKKPYSEIKSAVYIKGFEEKEELGVLSDWKPGFWKRRWLDDFDYVSFLNNGIKGA